MERTLKKIRNNQQENENKQQLKSIFNEKNPTILDQQAKQINLNLASKQYVFDQFLDTPKFLNQQRQKNKSFISSNQQKIVSNLEKIYKYQTSNQNSNKNNISIKIKTNHNNNIEDQTEGGIFSQNLIYLKETSPNLLKINTTSAQNTQQKLQQRQIQQKSKQQVFEKQINDFQSSNILLKEKTKKKYDLFFKQQKKNLTSFEKPLMPLETMKMTSNIISSDILIRQNKYLSAALLLTDTMENTQFFLSHTIYMIYSRLKQIFEHYHIYSEQLDQMLQSLNKKINLQVIVIFNLSKNHNNWMHTFFIVGQLLEKVLNQQQDRFG
ncbi:hypothetical protein TTHERM_00246960 (macronuclear) [Tetrahymena thermophila SB210]|uniref:Uncharacterized protein n=1 Tax=Tetrahymena thermophila (strain SB210) TaxID=312017 RepID=Q245Q3_TETTS|nr:hypothetical protein TTHERM_00246960 [Tetrahymena thermophila SB210]EAS03580.2 hypothetical protein TTHERM_00246960 [Tetrahymena thermophila SB210]|eukprot:XP_001023825.2 hypothetical protein TTHERM_00246960 [Tetrahymena thermophila SB210]